MPSNSPSSASTSASLLRRVKAREPHAWQRFSEIYAPLVYNWARRGDLNAHDAEDAVQDVFRSVFAKLDDFQNDGQPSRFRNWLWAITRNRVRLHYRQAGLRPDAIGGSGAAQRLQQYPDMLDSDTDPSNDSESVALLTRTLHTIEHDFSEQSWKAFWRVTVAGQTAADVSEELGISVSAVRQAKYRVLCRLRDELADF